MRNEPQTPSLRPSRQSRAGTYTAHHDMDSDERLSITVVLAVADVAGVDAAAIDPILYDSVDPDALDELFSSQFDGTPRTGGHVGFTLLDHDVTVYSDGEIVIREPERSHPTSESTHTRYR